MKKLLVTLMLALVSTNVLAEWTLVGTDEESTVSIDMARTRKADNVVRMWILKDFKTVQEFEGDKFLSQESLEDFDCKGERTRKTHLIWFSKNMGNGKVVLMGDTPATWFPVPPQSGIESLWKMACGKE